MAGKDHALVVGIGRRAAVWPGLALPCSVYNRKNKRLKYANPGKRTSGSQKGSKAYEVTCPVEQAAVLACGMVAGTAGIASAAPERPDKIVVHL